MRRVLIGVVFMGIISGHALTLPAATPQLVSATYLGTGGHDDLQDAAIAKDGTIYVVGNIDRELSGLPAGVKAVRLGEPAENNWYRCGFLAAFNPDGTKMLRCVTFARGQVFLTSVCLAPDGVYVGGYGVEKLSDLVEPLGGVFAEFADANAATVTRPLPGPLPEPPEQPDTEPSGPHEVLHIKTRHHGDKGGVPFVAKLSRDLAALEAATFLEGHHYAWNIAMPRYDEEWTPVGLAPLPGGDLVVCHDGGSPVHHYYAPDYLSRLSPDLKRRAWKVDIFHPEIRPIEKIRQRRESFKDWKYPILGHIRTLRMRGDGKGNCYVGGWSVSMTAREPWWCPFLWKFDQDGNVVWKAYSFDPMGGRENRMGGLVSDSAIRSMAVDAQGDLLVSGISDGGNTVLKRDPRDYEKPAPNMRGGFAGMKGRVLYVGHVMRLDARTRELLAGHGFGSYGQRGYVPTWAVDLCGLPGRRVLAVGRHGQNHRASPDAWFQTESDQGMFLKVLDEDLAGDFCVNVPDAIPYAAACRDQRCVIVGMAETGKTPTKRALFGKHHGGLDAYLMVADFAP